MHEAALKSLEFCSALEPLDILIQDYRDAIVLMNDQFNCALTLYDPNSDKVSQCFYFDGVFNKENTLVSKRLLSLMFMTETKTLLSTPTILSGTMNSTENSNEKPKANSISF